jgi:hypothetical protein
MSLLDGVLPYALVVGNHDGASGNQNMTTLFNQFFPVSRYQNLPTFGGVFESNRMDNSYHLFSAGGVDWLLFALEFGPRNSVLAWANQIATNYPNRRIILVTHTHVYSDNTLHGSSTNQLWQPVRDYGRENNGTDVWEKFLRRQSNAALVFNGHVATASGVGRMVGTGDYGNRVFQMLADFQSWALGGSGYLRIMQFFPDQDAMSVTTYSPYLNSWVTNADNQFTYTNLGIFANANLGYQVDTQFPSATLTITNPPPQTFGTPALAFVGLEKLNSGALLLSVTATNLAVVSVQWSSNWLTWTLLQTLTNTGGTLEFTDPGAAAQAPRYYRAVGQP